MFIWYLESDMIESSPPGGRLWCIGSNILQGNLMMVCSCCEKCIMIANYLGHFESREASIEVDGAVEIAHFKVCMSDFGFVSKSHSVLHQRFNEKGQIP